MATSFALWHCQLLRFFVFFVDWLFSEGLYNAEHADFPFSKHAWTQSRNKIHVHIDKDISTKGMTAFCYMSSWPNGLWLLWYDLPNFIVVFFFFFFLLWGRRSIVISYSNIWYKGTRSFLKGVGATSKFGQLQEVGQLHFKKFATSCREMLNLIIT